MQYTIFDFETATTNRMACQLAVVIIDENNIVESREWFIQPPNNYYDESCSKIHNINSLQTIKCKTFDLLWIEEISHFFENKNIVAHNLVFDKDVLFKNLSFYNIDHPTLLNEFCTYKITNAKITDLAFYFNYSNSDHHKASFDAYICSLTFISYLKGDKFDNLEILKNEKDFFKKTQKTIPSNLKFKNLDGVNDSHFFYNKKVVFTGDLNSMTRSEAAKHVYDKGGDINSSISSCTNYVIIGNSPGPQKLKKINELINNGINIKILNEDDFINLIK